MRAPTDAERLWRALSEAGRYGVHSFDIRARLGMGNPSQRVRDIESDRDVEIPRRREKRGSRMGIRYFHPNHPPAGFGDGTPSAVVEPSRTDPAEAGSGSSDSGSLPPLGAGAAADPGREPESEQLGLIARAPSIYDEVA